MIITHSQKEIITILWQVATRGAVVWEFSTWQTKQGLCHTVALPFTLTCILRQKKNYGNSNISPWKNIIFQKSSLRNQNPSRYLSMKEGRLFCFVVMRSTEPGCFRSCSWCLWKALNGEGCMGLVPWRLDLLCKTSWIMNDFFTEN